MPPRAASWSTRRILRAAVLGDTVQASLHGRWGFESYRGPSFRLMNAHAVRLAAAAGDEAALIVGRQDTVHLRADSVSCVDAIMLKDPAGKELKTEWKRLKPDEVEVKLPLQESQPGAMTLLVTQYGVESTAADRRAELFRGRPIRRLRHPCGRYARHVERQSPR